MRITVALGFVVKFRTMYKNQNLTDGRSDLLDIKESRFVHRTGYTGAKLIPPGGRGVYHYVISSMSL